MLTDRVTKGYFSENTWVLASSSDEEAPIPSRSPEPQSMSTSDTIQTAPLGPHDEQKRRVLSTFRFKVILSVFVLVLLLALSGFIFFLVERIFSTLEPSIRADLEWKTQRGAVELSQSADLGIALGDRALIERAFSDYRNNADVLTLVATDANGKVLVSQGKTLEDHRVLFEGPPGGLRPLARSLVSWSSSIIEGNTVGRVAVVISTQRLEAGQQLRRNMLGAVGIGVILALGVSLFFVNFYLGPLVNLTNQGQRAAREMEIAKRIQTSIVPSHPAGPGLEVSATMIPATEVGGDYYDVIPSGPNAWIAIGDVAGHGVQAGLIMMMAQSILNALVLKDPDAAPRTLMGTLNAVLHENIRHRLGSDEHITFTLLHHQANGMVTFAGAHEEIIIVRAATGKCERVQTPGAWLGAVRNVASSTKDSTLQLQPGDLLVLHTDGITEARHKSGELFGIERFCAELEKEPTASVEAIKNRTLAAVNEWMSIQDDDMTLVVIRHMPFTAV